MEGEFDLKYRWGRAEKVDRANTKENRLMVQPLPEITSLPGVGSESWWVGVVEYMGISHFLKNGSQSLFLFELLRPLQKQKNTEHYIKIYKYFLFFKNVYINLGY